MGLLIAISQENHSNSLKRIKYKYVTLTLLQGRAYVMSPISKEDVSTAGCTTVVSFCLAVSAEAEVSNAWNKLHFWKHCVPGINSRSHPE